MKGCNEITRAWVRFRYKLPQRSGRHLLPVLVSYEMEEYGVGVGTQSVTKREIWRKNRKCVLMLLLQLRISWGRQNHFKNTKRFAKERNCNLNIPKPGKDSKELQIYTTLGYIVSLILLNLRHAFRFHIVNCMYRNTCRKFKRISVYTKIFCYMKENLQRYLREMKDVFKELKVWGRKRKRCTSQIYKDILETIFTSTSTFSSTILVTFLELILEPRLVWIAIFYSSSSTMSSISVGG